LKDIYQSKRVEPFVEVRIEGLSQEPLVTEMSEGSQPEWNELLTFIMRGENGGKFKKDDLLNNRIMIYISIFDRELIIFKDDSSQSEYKL
jgi:hypothetical protein